MCLRTMKEEWGVDQNDIRGSGLEVKRCVPVFDRLFPQVFHVESETLVSSQGIHAGLHV